MNNKLFNNESNIKFSNPHISIIIPCLNEINYIKECLYSILSQKSQHYEFEIIIVDGMSTDGTRELIQKEFLPNPRVQLLYNPQGTVPCALNLGIMAANGKIIIRMDAHNIYPSNYISELVYWLENSAADNVGGICITKPAKDTPKARAIALALSHPFGVGNAYFRIGCAKPKWVDTVPFGCYRREVFDRIGLFDEELVRNQDDELNHRLIKQGGKILLVPQIVSEYYARDSLAKLWRMYWQYGYFKPLVALKVKEISTVRQLIPPFFISCLLITAIASFWIPTALKVFASIFGFYLSADLFFSQKCARCNDIKTKIWLVLTFPIIHFSYGFGYLKGILDFWLFKRRRTKYRREVPLSR